MSVAGQTEAILPFPPFPDPQVRRVLIYRLGSLGDTIVALPSLQVIARAFPDAERRMLTNVPVASRAPAAAAVLGSSGLIHSYERYPLRMRNPLQSLRLLLRLRRYRPDVAVYLKSTPDFRTARRDGWFLRLTGARKVIGLPESKADCIGRVQSDGCFEPEAERLLRSVRALGTADLESTAAWDIRLSEGEWMRAGRAIAPIAGFPYFAVSVGTKVQAKDWGAANWRETLRHIAKRYPGHALLLAGAAEERAASDTAGEHWSGVPGAGPVVNVCGELTPRESAGAFHAARAFLGHDSGPMHLAAAMGTPTLAVFSARNRPRTWFPSGGRHCVLYHRVDCWGCGLETCVEQRKKCILSVTAQEVVLALHGLLEPDALPQTESGMPGRPAEMVQVNL